MKLDVILGLQWGDEGKGKLLTSLLLIIKLLRVFRVVQTLVIP